MSLRSTLPILASLTLSLLHCPASESSAPPLAPAVELTPRGGLPNVLAKLNAGKDVRIAYLGGSITAAPGWRIKSLEWFKSQFPNANISEINAAIGGTGSGLGAFRVGEHVLKHQPDLLFVEFAVNDATTKPHSIHRSMEGIVRQTWQANPNTDICFVYTVSQPMLETLQQGKFPPSASAMENVAHHYQIPSIHMGIETAQLEKDGKLIFKSTNKDADTAAGKIIFSTDGVHPLVETGHALYTSTITRCIDQLRTIGTAAPHQLIAPLTADNMENARLLPINDSMLKGSWEKLDPNQNPTAKSFASRTPSLWKATKAGATLEVSFNGTLFDCYDLVGPDSGQLDVWINGELQKPVNRFDPYCTYTRLASFRVTSNPKPTTTKIKIQLSDRIIDKKNILFPHNRADHDKNPSKYQPHHWYLGGLLIIGKIES